MTRFLGSLATASALLLCSACVSDRVPVEADAAGSASGGGSGKAGAGNAGGGKAAGGTSGSPPASCPAGPDRATDTKPIQVGTVSGFIVDETGAPISAGLVQVCGKNLCINARVEDDGVLAESVNKKLDAPACKFGDGLTWGKLAVPIAMGDSQLGSLTTVRLPDFGEGVPFTPGEAITSGDVTLTLDARARVEVDELTYENVSEQGFRAAALPASALEQLQQDFVAGYVLSPVETRICPSPALSIKNTAELAPGTALELFVQGLDVLEEWAPYGGWQSVGAGQVSGDGKTLEFPGGLPLLTSIGVREKP